MVYNEQKSGIILFGMSDVVPTTFGNRASRTYTLLDWSNCDDGGGSVTRWIYDVSKQTGAFHSHVRETDEQVTLLQQHYHSTLDAEFQMYNDGEASITPKHHDLVQELKIAESIRQ